MQSFSIQIVFIFTDNILWIFAIVMIDKVLHSFLFLFANFLATIFHSENPLLIMNAFFHALLSIHMSLYASPKCFNL